MRIFKYNLAATHTQRILLPKGAKLLAVQEQKNNPVLWAEVEPSAQDVEREIIMLMTGEEYNYSHIDYIDTVQIGWLVAHYFDAGEIVKEEA